MWTGHTLHTPAMQMSGHGPCCEAQTGCLESFVQVFEAYAESEAESLETIQYGSECESTAPSARVYDLR